MIFGHGVLSRGKSILKNQHEKFFPGNVCRTLALMLPCGMIVKESTAAGNNFGARLFNH